MINSDDVARQVDILARAFPGQLVLPVKQACQAVGMARQTFFNKRWQGSDPFPVHRQGGRLVVLLEDVARAAVALGATPTAQPDPTLSASARAAAAIPARRGRPSRKEEAAAAAVGLTVSEYRAAGKGVAA